MLAPTSTPYRPSLRVARLEYHLFEPRSTHELAQAAYAMWRDQWWRTFRRLERSSTVHSDEFTRQDEIGALYLDGRCVSVTGLRWVDRSSAAGREDSYFQAWPRDALAVLGNTLVGITSIALIHPEWRGAEITAPEHAESEAIRLSLLNLALPLRRFTLTPARFAVGVTRNDRGMHRTAAELGAQRLGQTILYGAPSDLVYYPLSKPLKPSRVLDALWERRRQE